ncbi:MAG: molecular chaperone TorD family protein [Magnetococcales bacterium]|nr:molecular chaperone TorD family protein [Magnetococcales bacterium]
MNDPCEPACGGPGALRHGSGDPHGEPSGHGSFGCQEPRLLAAELSLLAHLLSQPVAESLEALEEEALTSAPWLADVLPELRQLPLDAWQGEHTRLFVNGFPKTICPPFVSFWRHGQWGGPLEGVLFQLYQRIGLEVAEGQPLDYLGVLLQASSYCLEVMASKPVDVVSPESEVLTHLLRDHLLLCLPEFAAALRQSAGLIFYRTLGERFERLAVRLAAGGVT